jgi:hypothetical protein
MTFQPITQRGSPANLDAEEALLACCILDESGDVIARAVELGITPATFSRPQCGSIFGALTRLAGPVDEFLLLQQLHTEGQLDFVGGMAEVNRIGNRVQSAALARTYMEAVRDAHTARRLSQSAAAIVEAVKAGQPLAEIAVKAEALADLGASVEPGEKKEPRSVAKLLAKAEALRFDLAKPPVEAPWLLKLCDTEILHPGNILSIIAPQKSGKSTTQSAIIASLFGLPEADFLGFQGRIPEGQKVIHFDTEQSARDHYAMMVRTLRRARWTDFPDWFSSLHVRRFSSTDRRKIMLSAARKADKEGGLALLMVDGLVDLLQDFNDVREATGLINDLMEICEETGCAVVSTLHVNPGSQKGKESDKGRGHLGTMLEQKSETILLLKKDTVQGVDHITLATKDARHGGVKDPPVFHWCDVAKMHVSLPLGEGFTPVPSLAKAQERPDTMATLARDIFDGWKGGAMPYSIIRERAMNAGRCAKSTAERRLNDLLRAGLVSKTDAGLYFLNESGPN